jgi:glycosyltransferase involved in cell wall biosynthesis
VFNISVVIPTYNSEQFIKTAIQSITNDNPCHYEIIVVDDGSTDGTGTLLAPLISNNKIKYVAKPRGGAASARNYGIRMAQGDYIGFLDADDIYLPDMIHTCVSELHNGNYDLVSVDNYIVYLEKGLEVRREYEKYDWIEIPPAELFCTFLKVGGIGGVHKAFFRKSVFDRVGLLDTSLPVYEDLDLWIRIARQGLAWKHIRQPLVQYHQRGSGTSLFTHSPKRNQNCRLKILRRYKDEAIRKYPIMRPVIAAQLWNFGRQYFYFHRSYLKALYCFLESILIDFSLNRISKALLRKLLSSPA